MVDNSFEFWKGNIAEDGDLSLISYMLWKEEQEHGNANKLLK